MRWFVLLTLLFACGAIAQAAEPPARAEARLVAVDFKDQAFRQAVDKLFAGSGVQYRVEPNVPNVAVTLSVKGVSLETAARLVMHVAGVSVPGLQLSRSGDIFVYHAGEVANPDPLMRPEKDPRLDGRVTLNLPQTTLREGVAAVLGTADIPYVVMPNVPNIAPLRLIANGVTRREALTVLMEQAHVVIPSLYVGQEGPVYILGISRAALLPGVPLPAAGGLFGGGRRGSLNVRDVGLQACLRIMARGSEYQIVVDPKLPDVKLTFNVKDVTLEEALQALVGELKKQGVVAKVTRQKNRFALEPGGEEA